MTRVKRGSIARKRRKKVFSLTKRALGFSCLLFRKSQQHAIVSRRDAYKRRQERKRKNRSIWVLRLNARIMNFKSPYSYFTKRTSLNSLNRKTRAQLAVYDPISLYIILVQFWKAKAV